ncbi:MAG: carboxymuconolactone decarboxylase family protein [Gemmataceae bacterium]
MALPTPPRAHQEFIERFPGIRAAWEQLTEAGKDGPLDEKTRRLVKFALAAGSLREGAVHAAVRKARAIGVTLAELEQIIALAAPTIGLPAAVAVYTWLHDLQPEGAGDPQT